jgi:site-specific recombinase XerC
MVLVDIEPLHVATYIEALHERMAKPTVKQHLAAIRMLFDWLVTGGILASNPATMRIEDYFANGKRWWVRLHEKGGKRHEMPAHHKLEAFLDEYLRAADMVGDAKSPLFRSAIGALASSRPPPCTVSTLGA